MNQRKARVGSTRKGGCAFGSVVGGKRTRNFAGVPSVHQSVGHSTRGHVVFLRVARGVEEGRLYCNMFPSVKMRSGLTNIYNSGHRRVKGKNRGGCHEVGVVPERIKVDVEGRRSTSAGHGTAGGWERGGICSTPDRWSRGGRIH